MIDKNVDDGIEVVNDLFQNAICKHGSVLPAVIAEVREGIKGLAGPQREAALKALDMALPVADRRH